MLNVAKENLCINKIVAHKKEMIIVEGDMIVPDSKPDILNTISTSGVVCIYKKELQEEKIRIDGNINTYIMYLPDQSEEGVRGLNTNLDFSEMINIPNCNSEMQSNIKTTIKSIECRVINGRKLGIKATLEIDITISQKEEMEIVNDITENEDIQMLKDTVNVNSLIGTGETKLFAKDTIQIDSIDLLAEILKLSVNITDKDIKISYNKILTKSEVEVKIMYLTEDNRINKVTAKIPIVGFVDIQNISENNTCDVEYEIRNMIIKPNQTEEHSIYVELEVGILVTAYEEKEINLINTNITAVHILTKLYLQDMVKKNNGHILNVASIAGMEPGPLMAAYYASKSYVIRFLHEDAVDGDVRVTIVGQNTSGFTLAFAKDAETVIDAEFSALPNDANGTLIIVEEEIPATA